MEKDYVVFNMRLAGKLMTMGFMLKKMDKTNRDDSGRSVFYFKKTDELIIAVEDWKKNNKL